MPDGALDYKMILMVYDLSCVQEAIPREVGEVPRKEKGGIGIQRTDERW